MLAVSFLHTTDLADVDAAAVADVAVAVAADDCLARDAAMARACSMALAVLASPGGTRLPPFSLKK